MDHAARRTGPGAERAQVLSRRGMNRASRTQSLDVAMDIAFRRGDLTTAEQSAVSNGFSEHSESRGAPAYAKERFTWLATGEQHEPLGALTADALWDWLYIDELWVTPEMRGRGLGRELMQRAEDFEMRVYRQPA